MSELESRSRPVQRHTGFEVGTNTEVGEASRSSRIRTTTNGTIVKGSDGDVEMGDDKKSVQPLPIPGSLEQRVGNGIMAASTQSPNDLLTPPDNHLLSRSSEQSRNEKASGGARIPRILSPRMSAIPSSFVSSGSASASSSHWSPGKSSDPHLYSISTQPYVYSSVKPYLSTSFKTSAERGGAASGSNNKHDDRNEMDEDDDEDDVFGNHTSQALGLLATGEPSPPQLRRSNDMEREEGDAAGVFSFSSPYFGPRSLEHSDVPPLSPPPPTDPYKRSQRLMSPSWTAATLGKLSLNGASPENSSSSSSTIRRPRLGQSPHQANHLSNLSAIQSQSLPSNADAAMSNQNRRLSFNRRPPVNTGSKSYHLAGSSGGTGPMLHPHTYSRSASGHRARSTSRSRLSESGTPRYGIHRHVANEDDDDETDEEAMVMDGEVEVEDDDATEDEADQRTNRFKSQFSSRSTTNRFEESHQSQARSIVPTSIPLHRHPSGQATTMSASFERANSGLNRQYASDRSDRYAGSPASHYALGRHHPYAVGSSNASPSNIGVLASYSPSSARVGMARRRSSFGNGSSAASPQPGHNMIQQLSHSPRYANARQQIGGPYEQQQQPYPSSLPAHAYQPSGYHYGESADSSTMRRGGHAPSSGLGRGQDQGGKEEDDEEEDEEDDEDGEDDEEEEEGEEGEEEEEDQKEHSSRPALSNTKRSSSKQARKSSASRPAAIASTQGGTGDVESSEMNEVNAIRERLGGAANCSAFISKLWYLMCRPELYATYIHWSESGDSVILNNDPDANNEFASNVLPKLFKHGNNASFVRQLNLYGFQRVPSSRLLDAAETRMAREVLRRDNISTALQLYGPHSSFAHPRFKKNQESLLPSMKPRSSKKTKKGGQAGTGRGGGDSEGED